jgi:hypothetical protein
LHCPLREQRAKPGILGFQLRNLGLYGGKCLLDFGFEESRDDVRRAIHVPNLDGEQDGALGPRFAAAFEQPLDQHGVVFDNARAAPQLDALAARGLEQEQKDVIVFGEIGPRDVLPIAAVVGKAERFVVECLDVKPFGPPRC